MALLAVMKTVGTATTSVLITSLLTSLVECVTHLNITSAASVTSGPDVDSLPTTHAASLIDNLDTTTDTDRLTITSMLKIINVNANTDRDSMIITPKSQLNNLNTNTDTQTPSLIIIPTLKINNRNTLTDIDSLNKSPMPVIKNPDSVMTLLAEGVTANNMTMSPNEDDTSSNIIPPVNEVFATITPKSKINNLNTLTDTDSSRKSPMPVIENPDSVMTLLAEGVTANNMTMSPNEDDTSSNIILSVNEVFATTTPKSKINNLNTLTDTDSSRKSPMPVIENPDSVMTLLAEGVTANNMTMSPNEDDTSSNIIPSVNEVFATTTPKSKINNLNTLTDIDSSRKSPNPVIENPDSVMTLLAEGVTANNMTMSPNEDDTSSNIIPSVDEVFATITPKSKINNLNTLTDAESSSKSPKPEISNPDSVMALLLESVSAITITTSPDEDVTSTEDISSFTLPDNASLSVRLMLTYFQNQDPGSFSENWRDNAVDTKSDVGLSRVGLICACVLIGAPGIVGNVLLLFMSFSQELRTKSFSLFLAAIAVSDSLGLVYLYTNSLITMYMGTHLSQVAHAGSKELCRILSLLPHVITTFPPWILVGFSFDRFIAVVFPLKRKSVCTVRNTRILCAAAVVLVIVMYMPLAETFDLDLVSGQPACLPVQKSRDVIRLDVYLVSTILVNSIVPSVLLIFLNVMSLLAIKNAHSLRARFKSSGTEAGLSSQEAREDQERRKKEMEAEAETRRATLALLSVPVVSSLTMTPFAVAKACVAITLFGVKVSTERVTWMEHAEPYLIVLYTVGYAGNFWLLLITSKSYRNITKKMLRLCRP